ncbi:MAG: DUF4886 domain-containing protein [Kiritimatiellia bacterium]
MKPRRILMPLMPSAGRIAIAAALALSVSAVRAEKKVLMIGNSFSQSVLSQLPAIAAADGEDLDISNLMIGGCVLSRHVSNVVAYAQDPTFRPYKWPRYRNGRRIGESRTNIPEALAADRWDVVTIQQGSSASWRADSFHPWGDELVATIRRYAPQAKIMVQQTWTYNELNRCICDPYTGGAGWFGIDRDTMYRNLTSNYYGLAAKYGFEVIPMGNAVELLRHRLGSADPAEDPVGRLPQPKRGWFDLIHLNDRGCYLQAYVWYKALFGKDPRRLADAKDERDRLLREVAYDVFAVPPFSIAPYPCRTGGCRWRDFYVGAPEGLATLTGMPGTFRLDVAASVPSGSVGVVCGPVLFALAADGAATASWRAIDGTDRSVTWPGVAKDPQAATLRLFRISGGTSLWHFCVDGVELGRADTARVKADAAGAFPKPSVVVAAGASVGRLVLARPLEDLPGYEKVQSAKLACADPQGWAFSCRKEGEDEPGVEIWRLEATSPTNATLPRFTVEFAHPTDGVRRFHPARGEGGGSRRTGFVLDAGVSVALGDDELSRLAAVSSEAVEATEVGFGFKDDGSALAATYAFGTQATDPCTNYVVRFRLDSRRLPLWRAVPEALRWQRLAAGLDVTPAPEAAYDPGYSTGCAYRQEVSAGAVLQEAKAGAAMGLANMCVDGDRERRQFPNMALHVRQVHEAGMKYVLRYALPQLGAKSEHYGRFRGRFLAESPTGATLDPRYPEVRGFLADACERAMREWDVDGFSFDGLDAFALRTGEPDPAAKHGFDGCDTRSLMRGAELLLREIRTRLQAMKRDTLIEFRPPGDGQALRQYGNVLRAGGAPGDACANRANVARLRLAGEDTAVHGDLLAWPQDTRAEEAALQPLNALFSSFRCSQRLARGLSADDRKLLAHWIRFSQEHRDALLRGAFRPHHAGQGFPVIEGENGLERIVAVYAANVPAPCVADRDVYLVNATGTGAILIEADAAATASLFDVFGEPAGTARIAKGLQRLAVPESGYARVASAQDDIVFRADAATMRLAGASGAILSLKGADGVELLERADEFFVLQLLDAGGNGRRLRSSDFRLERVGDTLVFTRDEGPRVTVKVGLAEGRFDFTPTVSCVPAGWLLEWFDGPQPYVASTGGRLYWPFYDGCEVSDLKQRESAVWADYRPIGHTPRCKAWGALYPGHCQMQFMAYYRDGRGLYFGCHDPTHTQMGVEYDWRGERATRLSLQMFCGEAEDGVWTAPAPFTLRLFAGGWMEACEIYRDFVRTLPEFATPVRRPQWMYDSPVNLIYPVRGKGLDCGPEAQHANCYYPFVNVMPAVERYGRLFESKIMALVMHWEGTAPWCPPYVWPPLGGEQGLAELRDALHARGDLLGLYCSGCAWTQTSCISDYSQERKCREEGLERWMMRGPKGQLEATICNHRNAQRFGYDLCLTEKWSQDTLVAEIGKIARFGADYCQWFDQNIGGAALLCYSREHRHPPVPGAWQTKAMLELQARFFAKIAESGSQMTLGCEACAATPFVKNLFYNDSRANADVGYGKPVAGVPFVFHEWMSNFSGNQISSDADVGYRWMSAFHQGDSFSVVLGADGKLQPAWGIAWDRPCSDQARLIALVKNLNAVRKANLPWLLEGRMLRPFAQVSTRPATVRFGEHEIATEAVMSSFWQAPDGRRRAFLSNWGLKDAAATVTLADGTRRDYRLKPGEVVWFDGDRTP